MKVLVIDVEGLNLDYVMRARDADHEVRWYKQPWKGKHTRDGEGMKGFSIVEEWKPSMTWADLVFVTGNFVHIHELDRYRKEFGHEVFGPTVASAALEIDRAKGMEAMEAAGISVPPYTMFDSLESAIGFAKSSDRAWVFKPMGDSDDKGLTYVSKDSADMVGWLKRQIARGKQMHQCMLQERVDKLAEIGVSGWLGPDGFLPGKWQICFEHKKLMNGDVGPNTGEQGTVCQYVIEDKLAEELLKPMEPILRTLGHRGDFAVGAMIDTTGRCWPLEFTARAGYPAWYIQMASHRGDPVKWMKDLLDGKDSLSVRRSVAIGVVMSQPRYPYGNTPPELVEGNPIDISDAAQEDLHFVSVMQGKPDLETTGEYVLVATGLGSTVERARKRVYETVDEVHFADSMYRTDIGECLKKQLPLLHRHGYAVDMEY